MVEKCQPIEGSADGMKQVCAFEFVVWMCLLIALGQGVLADEENLLSNTWNEYKNIMIYEILLH